MTAQKRARRTDQAKAKTLYDDAQKQIVNDAPNLFLANQNQFLAYSPKLTNFTAMPDESGRGSLRQVSSRSATPYRSARATFVAFARVALFAAR